MSNQADLVMTSVRLDRDLHAALRQIAFDRRVSIHSLLIEGAREAAAKYVTPASTPVVAMTSAA